MFSLFAFSNNQQFVSTRQLAASCVLFFLLSGLTTNGQSPSDTLKTIDLQQVIITATMASDKTPMTFTNLKKDQIRKNDFGQDVPYLLKSTPSVVETSDAGAGVGYTGIRIRGTDATRINVTVDGVPINDPESQAMYWVDMPDVSSSTSMIQVQRGVGTSTNGAAAFGATINMVSNALQPEKYVNYTGGFGSFNTFKNSISAGTGLMKNKLAVDMRLSSITSDGYVDRAATDMQSLYLSGLYLGKNSSLKFKLLSGKEKTYQSWYGIPVAYVSDSKLRTYNPAGTDRVSNPYENQTDNYKQTHAHLAWNQQVSTAWKLSATGHFTHGEGYYEEYKGAQKLNKYFTEFPKIKKDLIRQLWLKNDFYGGIFSTNYQNNQVDFTLGGGVARYDGNSFGKVVWVDSAGLLKAPKEFYRSQSMKNDVNIFSKINYNFTGKFSGFADLQVRTVGYSYSGTDRKVGKIDSAFQYKFFNPKLGLNYAYTEGGRFYGSFAVGNREPNRDDLIQAPANTPIKSERLFNTEIGWKTTTPFGGKGAFGANFYHMAYKNQLVLTGQINDVGEAVRLNVPESYRLGIEMEASIPLSKNWFFNANAAFSQNKIGDFTEFRDNWDTGGQTKINHGKTDIAFSPNAVVNGEIVLNALKNKKHDLSFVIAEKYVGQQFIDNTSNSSTSLPAYYFTDFKVFYKTQIGFIKNITCKLLINNILNQKYTNNAWTYRFTSAGYDPRPDDPYARSEKGDVYNLTGYFPQAGRLFMLGVSVGF
jgi:iron complex outermembrane recepter protein